MSQSPAQTTFASVMARTDWNDLQKFSFIARRTIGGSEEFWMNCLQDRGWISDNCVTAADVYEAIQAAERLFGKPLTWFYHHVTCDFSKPKKQNRKAKQ